MLFTLITRLTSSETSTICEVLKESGCDFVIEIPENYTNILSVSPVPDCIIFGPDLTKNEVISFLDIKKSLKSRVIDILARSKDASLEELIEFTPLFNHLIIDLNFRPAIKKKISNIRSVIRLMGEKKKFKKLEAELEEESAKLVEVNVNNVKLLAEVNHQKKMIELARRDVKNLLDNLGQGFLTVNREGLIQPGWSKSVETLFNIKPEGSTLPELLRQNSEEAVKTMDWLNLIYDQIMPFKDLKELGTASIEIDNRYIELDYRVISGDSGSVDRIIVIGTDKTLEREYAKKSAEDERFSRMILMLIRDRSGFLDYVNETENIICSLEKLLNNNDSSVIGECFRLSHTLKGNSGAFHLEETEEKAHLLESSLGEIRDSSDLEALYCQNKDVLCLHLKEVKESFEKSISSLEEVLGSLRNREITVREIELEDIMSFYQYIRQHFSNNHTLLERYCTTFVNEPILNTLRRFEPIVEGIAERIGKKASLTINDNGLHADMKPYKSLVQSFIHILRNALDHGIEFPEEREMSGKPENGSIEIITEMIEMSEDSKRMLVFTVQDDGQGIDAGSIRKKAIKRELCSTEKASSLSDEEVLSFLFHPGFSTSETVTEFSGRGVGLDAVKSEAEKLGGSVSISSKSGEGSKITITVPEIQEESLKTA